ncbi:hypothetical protein P8452_75283 [Trifolium repens]|nr:hypothetical protein P8452_75283 [Trifolium repens]
MSNNNDNNVNPTRIQTAAVWKEHSRTNENPRHFYLHFLRLKGFDLLEKKISNTKCATFCEPLSKNAIDEPLSQNAIDQPVAMQEVR